jgi:hypothetical protein
MMFSPIEPEVSWTEWAMTQVHRSLIGVMILQLVVFLGDVEVVKHFSEEWLGGQNRWSILTNMIIALLNIRMINLTQAFKQSRRESVLRKYKSELLGLTSVLCAHEMQKEIYEPMYSDWIDERAEFARRGSKFESIRVDIFYRSRFLWRIWREIGLIRSLFGRGSRNEPPPSILGR